MDISIIIVSYNVKEYIISCIQSIYKHSSNKIDLEIIIIDNNSNDGSVSAINKKFPDLLLIKNDYNAGFSRAVNQGYKHSKGKYLFILNPDTCLIEDSIGKLLKKAEEIPNVGAIGPALINKENKVQKSFWREPTLINTVLSIYHLDFLNFFKNYYDKSFANLSKVDSVSGCAILIPSGKFSELNGFNENLFWMDDIDFCTRLRLNNYGVYYFQKTRIIHYSGRSIAKNYKVAISNQMLSKLKYFNIYHSMLKTKFLKLSILIICILKIIIYLILYPFSFQNRLKLEAYKYTFKLVSMKRF